MPKKLVLSLLLLMLTALTACAAKNTGPAQTAADKVYIINQNGFRGLVKADGTVLFKPVYTGLSVLTDVFTHEQKYIEIYKVNAGTKRDQYGRPVDATSFDELYDLSGKPMGPDVQNLFYSNPIGDYVMVDTNNKYLTSDASQGGYFINFKTNQEYYRGISDYAISKHTLLAYFDQTKQAILFDSSLKPIKTIHDVQSIAVLYGLDDYYTITNQAGMVGVINGRGKQVLPYQHTSYNSYYANPNCLLTDNYTKVIDLTGHTLMQAASGYKFSSYGGKAAVWETDQKNVNRNQYLVDLNGKIISQAYDTIGNDWFAVQAGMVSQASQTTIYVGYLFDQKDNNMFNKVDIIDATGKILYSTEGESLWLRCVTPNCFILTKTVAGVNYAKVINAAGQEIIPDKQGANIDIINDQAGQSMPYLLESYTNSQGAVLFDIYDLSGQPVLKGLNGFSYCDGQIINGSQGFNTGIMDMQGHWLYKQSIFDNLNTDN